MDDPQDTPLSASDTRLLLRLSTRAALYAAPETLITAREFCRAMAVRARSARQLKPPTLVRVGNSNRAPFREWLAQLQLLDPVQAQPETQQPSIAELRAPKRRR